MNTAKSDKTIRQVGGAAALYLALAYLAAMPYFLLVVDYPSATTVAAKMVLVLANYPSMYAMYLATYVFFGIVLGVLVLVLHNRLRGEAPFAAGVAAVVGLMWAFALVASGMVYTYGMTTITTLAATDRAQAVLAWQAIEPVALALGGAGGELLGGLWVLLVSWLALRLGALPKVLGWLGVAIGALGVVSVVPPLHNAAYVYGLVQIVWFAWLGVALLRGPAGEILQSAADARTLTSARGEQRLQPNPSALD